MSDEKKHSVPLFTMEVLLNPDLTITAQAGGISDPAFWAIAKQVDGNENARERFEKGTKEILEKYRISDATIEIADLAIEVMFGGILKRGAIIDVNELQKMMKKQ